MEQRQPGETLETYCRRVAYLNRALTLGSAEPSPVRRAWSDWLGSFPWEAWGTLTFRWPDPTHAQLDRAWGGFVTWIRRAATNDAPYFLAHEVGAGGRAHLHCLLGGLHPYVDRTRAWGWWFKRYGRCEVRGYDPARGAADYVSKYMVKDLAHYDVDLGAFIRCHSPPPSGLPSWKRTRVRTASSRTLPGAMPCSPGGPNTTA